MVEFHKDRVGCLPPVAMRVLSARHCLQLWASSRGGATKFFRQDTLTAAAVAP